MNDTTRRGFLGLLAHVPFVGVLFAGHLRAANSDKQLRERMKVEEDAALRKAQAEVRAIRWIPVTERFPEEGVDVLWWHSEFPSRAPYIDHWREVNYWDRKAKEWRPEKNGDLVLSLGTHWAELPAPPSEVPA